jgi:hypothetical protein
VWTADAFRGLSRQYERRGQPSGSVLCLTTPIAAVAASLAPAIAAEARELGRRPDLRAMQAGLVAEVGGLELDIRAH